MSTKSIKKFKQVFKKTRSKVGKVKQDLEEKEKEKTSTVLLTYNCLYY